MKQTIGFSQFRDAFINMDRKETFSYEGQKALFEYLEQYEEDCDEEIELDVIALCCEYTEYSTIADFNADYNTEYGDYKDIDETIVIPVDDEAFIIQQF